MYKAILTLPVLHQSVILLNVIVYLHRSDVDFGV